jgi:hypothetical protein
MIINENQTMIANKIQTMRHIDTSEISNRIQFAVGDALLHRFMLILVPLQVQIKEDLKNV